MFGRNIQYFFFFDELKTNQIAELQGRLLVSTDLRLSYFASAMRGSRASSLNSSVHLMSAYRQN